MNWKKLFQKFGFEARKKEEKKERKESKKGEKKGEEKIGNGRKTSSENDQTSCESEWFTLIL